MDKVLAPGQSQSDRALWHFWINGAMYLVKVAIIPTPLFPFFAHTLTIHIFLLPVYRSYWEEIKTHGISHSVLVWNAR